MSLHYTAEQKQFLRSKIKSKKTFVEIAPEFNRKFNCKVSSDALQKVAKRAGMVPAQNLERQRESKTASIVKTFADLVKVNGYVPTTESFCQTTGIARGQVYRYFENPEALEKAARESYPKIFSKIIDETSFSQSAFSALERDIKRYRRFVITTAVTGCEPHVEGLKALQSYCAINNAKLLVLPCSDPAKTLQRKYAMSLSSKIPAEAVVFKDLFLNYNLLISTIKLSAKQINPLTGLRRLGHKGSCVLASPKQALEHVANSNKQGIPRAIMTTGAITVSDYNTELYMSERTAYLANEDHCLGAIIVEVKDERTFFYRRIQISGKSGSFSDLDKRYFAKGTTAKITAQVLNQPDWHTASLDPEFRKVAKKITELMQPETMTFEDFFDGASINPHEKNNIVIRSQKALAGLTLQEELKMCQRELDDLQKWPAKQIVLKYGNHDDFLKRWLSLAEYKDDPLNHYEGVCLAKALLEGSEPLEYAMRERYGIAQDKPIFFLKVNDTLVINGIENAVHGHLGSGGKRSPGMVGMEAYGSCTVGHSHSAAILRNVVRVGTATHLQLPYNDGASAWTQTLCIQHWDGARQLISVIDGEFCLPDMLELKTGKKLPKER